MMQFLKIQIGRLEFNFNGMAKTDRLRLNSRWREMKTKQPKLQVAVLCALSASET